MSSEFESIDTGIAAHIGKHADAVRIPAGAEVVYTSVVGDQTRARVQVEVIAVRQPAA